MGLRHGSSHAACKGIKSIAGMQTRRRNVESSDMSDTELEEELNTFSLRSDAHDLIMNSLSCETG